MKFAKLISSFILFIFLKCTTSRPGRGSYTIHNFYVVLYSNDDDDDKINLLLERIKLNLLFA